MKTQLLTIALLTAIIAGLMTVGGCGGYQNSWLHPQDVTTVYVEMFDTKSFRRGYEYELTDAVCKRIESHTPYKIVSDRNIADTVLTGRLGISVGVLSGDRYTGTPMQYETRTTVTVTWKNLKTGQLLIDNQEVHGSADYSTQLGQTENYALSRAVNKAAQHVVELMENPW